MDMTDVPAPEAVLLEHGADRVMVGAPEVAAAIGDTDQAVSGGDLLEDLLGISMLAEREGLLGLQDVCARVLHNAGLMAESDMQPGCPARELLDGFPPLAHVYLASRQDPDAADLLIGYLSAAAWPEPLGTEDAEGLRFILQAGQDMQGGMDWPAADVTAEAGSATAPGTADQDVAAVIDEPVEVAAQSVNQELIALLGSELAGMQGDLDQFLSAAAASDGGGHTEAVAAYAEQIERLSLAAESVGLAALKSFLASLHTRLSAAAASGLSPQQCEILSLLPSSILAYLAAPADPSTCEGLIDLLRGDMWATPLAPAHAASLSRVMAMVELTKDLAGVEPRQTEARPGDVSLAIPADLNQELLDGLLQELPVQTGEFSAAIQRIAAGNGTLKDVDAAKRASHTLKGAANTVGIKGIANLTHHVEDILVALSNRGTLPNRALAEALTNAGDCLEAMSEAVMGTGPEPDYALPVLQDILDWANRIDRDGVAADEGETAPGDTSGTVEADAGGEGASDQASATVQASEAMIRVPASLVDELLRLVGETIISTGQVRERVRRVLLQNKTIRAQNSVFLQLATELEELVDMRGATAGFGVARDNEEFDPLEFEHYSELHTVSRRLIEATTDTGALSAEVDKELSDLNELVEVQSRLHAESQNAVMRTRMVPIATVISRLQRSVRQAGRLLDKRVVLNVSGADTMIDSNILNELVDPLMHMLRNAVDHGIEPAAQRVAAGKPVEGRIDLAFTREGNHVVVRCRDDGHGLDLATVRRTAERKGLLSADQVMSDDELARLILTPGFSTRTESTQVSGRGIGMDVVHSRVLQLKGELALHAEPGQGLKVELRLPAMLISTHALLVRSRGRLLAISSYGIQDIHYVTPRQVQKLGEERYYRTDNGMFPLAEIESLLNLQGERRGDERREGFPVLMVRDDSGTVHAVTVQEIIDSRDLVVKNLGPYVPRPLGVVGATILGDGSVAAVMDLPELMRKPVSASGAADRDDGQSLANDRAHAPHSRLMALVVDDSLSARRATAQFMKDSGFEVRTAIDGLEAIVILDKWKPDILLVDMEMPRMNGLELTAHVRARPDIANIPVIMITSRSTEKHRRQAEAAGVSTYLTKPFGEEDLLRHVAELTAA
jgi:chemosensory pili system protein ChpA (sensor histidine kinase/response regulator)